jgi:hypothetical protein
MWIDIGKLIREHVPDKNGRTLPSDLTMGAYEIRDLTNKGVGTLFEGKVIYDKTYGHVAYGCGVCCGYKTPSVLAWYNPLGLPVLGTGDDGVNATDSCSLQNVDVSDSFYGGWSTANTSIATVDYYGTHSGVAVGSTTSSTWGDLQVFYRTWSCPINTLDPGGGVNTKPTISGPNTLWWFNGLGAGVSGYANQITLTANSGGTGTSYQWAITAGSDKVSLSTSASATVQVTSIGQSAQANDVSITVTVGGMTSNPFNLTVRAPYTLGADPDHLTPVYGQNPPTEIWSTDIYYRVLDNLLAPLPTPLSLNESWTTGIVPDYTNENWPRPDPNCDSINSAAVFHDHISPAQGYYPTPVFNQQQNGPAVQEWGQDLRVGTCNLGSGPRVQKDTLVRYIDHGAHTAIVSPAP